MRSSSAKRNVSTPDVEPQVPMALAVKAIAKTLAPVEAESAEQTMARIYQDFCGLVDGMGAAPVMQCLQEVAKNIEAPSIRLATEAIRKACMRCEGHAFGKLYDGYLMMLPLVLRGPIPARFPTSIPKETMNLVHSFLREVLRRRVPNGADIYPLPVSFLYTMHEFADEKLTKMHEILRLSFASVSPHASMATAPDHIVTEPAGVDENRFDDELFDLTIAKPGLDAWQDRTLNRSADQKPVHKLHAGDWTTFRLMPMVMLVPHGETPPTIDGFDADAEILGSILSMASIPLTEDSSKSKRAQPEYLGVSIVPIGIQTPENGPKVARTVIAQSRLLTDVLRAQANVEEGTTAFLNYVPSQHTLHVIYTDGMQGIRNQMILEPGLQAQLFIERLFRDMTGSGIPTQVDMGDSMIRQGAMPNLMLH